MTYTELINDIHDIRQQHLDNSVMIDNIANKIVDYVLDNDQHIENFDFKSLFFVIESL